MPSLALIAQSLASGIFIGALYGLLGLGLSLAWGLLGQINLAHFALAFLGAYLTYQLGVAGLDPLATLVIVLPAFFVFGAALHWLLARFAVSAFNSLLITFGLTVIIEEDNGGMSYWALKHAPGKPDFHHRDAFALELDELRH